jgi:DNA-binding response OmpR family regulator
MAKCLLLIVDHEQSALERVMLLLATDGYAVRGAGTSYEAIDLARRIQPLLLVINPQMPDLSGVEVASQVSHAAKCKVIFLSDLARDPDFREMLHGLREQGCECSAVGVPFEDSTLLAQVRREIGPPTTVSRVDEGPPLIEDRNQIEAMPNKARVSDYQPLLDMAEPQLYDHNAFRVTGLAVDASLRDISKAAQRLEMIAKGFGVPESVGTTFSTAPPSAEEIRTALQCLKSPEQRLLHELFWFWPTSGPGEADPALSAIRAGDVKKAENIWDSLAVRQRELRSVSAQLEFPCSGSQQEGLIQKKGELQRAAAVSIHNLAVLNHVRALTYTSNGTSRLFTEYVDPVAAWTTSLTFWRTLLNQSAFWIVFADRVRSINDPRLSIDITETIWASLPLTLLSLNAEFAVAAAEACDFEEAGVQRKLMKASELGDDHVRDALFRKLKPLSQELGRLCQSVERTSLATPEGAVSIVGEFFGDKKKYLQTFNYLLGQGDSMRDEAHDLVSATARSCLVAYANKTEDWEGPVPLFEECLILASSSSLRSRLEDDLEMLAKNAAGQRAAKQARHDAFTQQHSSTPTTISPARRAGRRFARPILIGAVLLVCVIIRIATMNESSSSSSAGNNPPTDSGTSSSSQSAPTSPGDYSGIGSRSETPSASGSADSAEESALRAAIEQNRATLRQMEDKLANLKRRVATLNSQIESDKATLQEIERNHELGNEVDVDLYESTRRRHNSTVDTQNELVEEYNSARREYKSLLSTTNDQIDHYNTLVRAQ